MKNKETMEYIEIDPIKPYGYIYLTLDLITNKMYIGQSTKIQKKYFLNYFGSGTIIRKKIHKNKENYKKFILSFAFSKEELDTKEILYIKLYNTLIPNGYNIREGGNTTGIRYMGQLNPASKTNMSYEKIREKTQKGIETKIKNNTLYVPPKIKKTKEEWKKIAKKSHKTQKERGTNKIRILNGHITRLKNNCYKNGAIKSARTIREKHILSNINNPKSKFIIIAKSPENKFIFILNNKKFCKEFNITYTFYRNHVMNRFLDNIWFKINLKEYYGNNYSKYAKNDKTKNIDRWSFIKIKKEVFMECFKDFELQIELVDDNATMPTRATEGDVGLDFYTPIDVVIEPMQDALIPLGIKTSFPTGYGLIFMEKSGVSVNKKCDVLAKVIDPGYRGIVHAHLFNNSNKQVFFKKGDKVVQGVVMPVWTGIPTKVESVINNSERGEGGFGSTGK